MQGQKGIGQGGRGGTLVGANSGVVLDAVPAVDLDLAFVVEPGHAEHHHALGLHQALHHRDQLRPLLEHRHQRLKHLLYGLQELGLRRVARLGGLEEPLRPPPPRQAFRGFALIAAAVEIAPGDGPARPPPASAPDASIPNSMQQPRRS